jgi:hypothetical protein
MATTRTGKKKEGSTQNTNSDSNQTPTQEPPHNAVSVGSPSQSPGKPRRAWRRRQTPSPPTAIAQESFTVSPDSQAPAKKQHKANYDAKLTSWFTQPQEQLYLTLFAALQSYFGPPPKSELEDDDP